MYYEEPTPHIFIEKNALPIEVYKNILENLPETSEYEKTTYHRSRHMLNILHPDYLVFWGPIIQAYLLPTAEDILSVFGQKTIKEYSVEIWLIRDLDGYYIPPHTDIKERVISMLYYLPEDNSIEEFGTCLCTHKDKDFTSDGSVWFEKELEDDFTVVKQAPFAYNSLFAFLRTDTSFHCVPKIDKPGIVRNVLLVMVKEK
jgi:hypothetical protein